VTVVVVVVDGVEGQEDDVVLEMMGGVGGQVD
jgi:hypothetical protein